MGEAAIYSESYACEEAESGWQKSVSVRKNQSVNEVYSSRDIPAKRRRVRAKQCFIVSKAKRSNGELHFSLSLSSTSSPESVSSILYSSRTSFITIILLARSEWIRRQYARVPKAKERSSLHTWAAFKKVKICASRYSTYPSHTFGGFHLVIKSSQNISSQWYHG